MTIRGVFLCLLIFTFSSQIVTSQVSQDAVDDQASQPPSKALEEVLVVGEGAVIQSLRSRRSRT
jgi:hypothetical protein